MQIYEHSVTCEASPADADNVVLLGNAILPQGTLSECEVNHSPNGRLYFQNSGYYHSDLGERRFRNELLQWWPGRLQTTFWISFPGLMIDVFCLKFQENHYVQRSDWEYAIIGSENGLEQKKQ